MKKFKLSIQSYDIFYLTKYNFEKYTYKQSPYYWYKHGLIDKSRNPVAVCPYCNNPIIIINIYKNPDKIYAKHYPHSIQNLASFNRDAYLACPYSRSDNHKYDKASEPLDRHTIELLSFLMNNFDKIIYALSCIIGISISDKLATKMLEHYIKIKGYTYKYSNISNIVYTFGYRADRFSIYGMRLFNPDDKFINAIKIHNNLVIKDNRIDTNKYTNIEGCFLFHKERENKMTYTVYNDNHIIYQKDVFIQANILSIYDKGCRNKWLLKIAQQHIGACEKKSVNSGNLSFL